MAPFTICERSGTNSALNGANSENPGSKNIPELNVSTIAGASYGSAARHEIIIYTDGQQTLGGHADDECAPGGTDEGRSRPVMSIHDRAPYVFTGRKL